MRLLQPKPRHDAMDDVVVDTNVLAHAENPNDAWFEASRGFFSALLASNVRWCLDEGFSPVESQNRSRIYSEYRATVLPVDLGMQVLAHLAGTGRVQLVPRPSSAVRQQIRRLVPRNTRDRVFIEVAYGCVDRLLVSHDYADFHDHCRSALRTSLAVDVIDAGSCALRIQSSGACG